MHRMNIAALTATIALGVLTGVASQASAQDVTAYEGARVIVGDGRVLDNGANKIQPRNGNVAFGQITLAFVVRPDPNEAAKWRKRALELGSETARHVGGVALTAQACRDGC